MKLHPKAKAALKYYNAHCKERDIEKCNFALAAKAKATLKKYEPEIAKRTEASFRTIRNSWLLYLGAEFSIHLEAKPQSFSHAISQMREELKEYPSEDLTEFFNDIPF